MILPIYAYGHPVLKKVASNIDKSYPNLSVLLANMWDTMYNAHGVGLAAPQIGLDIRLFIVDTLQVLEEEKPGEGIKMAFINAKIVEESGEEWSYEEGCLSIPYVRGDVSRQEQVTIEYFDESFTKHTKTFSGLNARVIQHEYDHIQGILFTEKLKPLKKKLVQKKLDNIKKGNIKADYKIKFVV
ncbi:MAG: peptide deformylase [Saprospiraceae bacterium]|jgi:peptide deformylase|nr:peptide deformylase [Saprospiraceae bacterium]